MGLISNILIGIAHLLSVVMDIFLLMIATKIIYDCWQISWLEQAVKAIEPILNHISTYAQRIAMNITGKTYTQKTNLLLTIICVSAARLIIAGLL